MPIIQSSYYFKGRKYQFVIFSTNFYPEILPQWLTLMLTIWYEAIYVVWDCKFIEDSKSGERYKAFNNLIFFTYFEFLIPMKIKEVGKELLSWVIALWPELGMHNLALFPYNNSQKHNFPNVNFFTELNCLDLHTSCF